jgi:hypothetical protein
MMVMIALPLMYVFLTHTLMFPVFSHVVLLYYQTTSITQLVALGPPITATNSSSSVDKIDLSTLTSAQIEFLSSVC